LPSCRQSFCCLSLTLTALFRGVGLTVIRRPSGCVARVTTRLATSCTGTRCLALRCRLAARRINGESRRGLASGLGGVRPLDQIFDLASAPASGTGEHLVAAREANLLPAACRLPFAPARRRRTERCRRRGSYCRGAACPISTAKLLADKPPRTYEMLGFVLGGPPRFNRSSALLAEQALC
jgi:hypothetical protein